MTEKRTKSGELEDAVVRICPACGVVNPSGPSETCPHLQLARFDGIDDSLAEMLDEVAKARHHFAKCANELKDRVKQAIRDHEAEVEMSRRVLRPSEVEALRPSPKNPSALALRNPEPHREKAQRQKRKAKRHTHPPPVDPRQLELIVREPPKGDA